MQQSATLIPGGPRSRLARGLRRGWRSLIQRQELVVAVLLLVFGILLSMSTSSFFTATNLMNIALSFSWYVIAAFGALMVIIVGGIDLSVGAVMALAGMIGAMALDVGLPLPLALLCGLGSGALVGMINGLLVGRTGLPPFMVTLGTMGITRGVVLSLTSGAPVMNLSPGFRYLGQGEIAPGAVVIPLPVIWMLLIAVVMSVLLQQTVLGQSERALRVAGISPRRVKIVVYTLSGVLAGLAGLILTARLGVAAPMAASGYELDIIAAAVIGGASLFGGQGTVTGVLLGASLIQVIRNGVVLLGLSNQNQWQFVTIGAMILVVLLLDYWRRQRV